MGQKYVEVGCTHPTLGPHLSLHFPSFWAGFLVAVLVDFNLLFELLTPAHTDGFLLKLKKKLTLTLLEQPDHKVLASSTSV